MIKKILFFSAVFLLLANPGSYAATKEAVDSAAAVSGSVNNVGIGSGAGLGAGATVDYNGTVGAGIPASGSTAPTPAAQRAEAGVGAKLAPEEKIPVVDPAPVKN